MPNNCKKYSTLYKCTDNNSKCDFFVPDCLFQSQCMHYALGHCLSYDAQKDLKKRKGGEGVCKRFFRRVGKNG
jgi:hypothetical protein